jgi:hypothetical protein
VMSKSMGLRRFGAFLTAISVWGGSARAGLISVNFAGGSPLTVTGAGVIGNAGDTLERHSDNDGSNIVRFQHRA